MPIYEFYCADNHTIYSFLAPGISWSQRIPRCPENPGFRMEKRVSSFAITGRHKDRDTEDPDQAGDLPPGMDQEKMEALLADMERDLVGVDDENPDPKVLSRILKKMSTHLGETPPHLEDLIDRLDRGEDPASLEKEFEQYEFQNSPFDFHAFATKTLKSRRPKKDPTLYDMRDYVSDD